MNFDKIPPNSETEVLIVSKTKNCETIIEQNHKKPQETLEFKLNRPRDAFHFKKPIPIE